MWTPVNNHVREINIKAAWCKHPMRPCILIIFPGSIFSMTPKPKLHITLNERKPKHLFWSTEFSPIKNDLFLPIHEDPDMSSPIDDGEYRISQIFLGDYLTPEE